MIAFYVIIAGVGLWAAYTTRNGFQCSKSYQKDVTKVVSLQSCNINWDNDENLSQKEKWKQ